MRRLTRRRQVKNRSKHSRHNKYKKTRRGKYVKKRRDVTRRRVLRGGDEVEDIINAIYSNSPYRFRLLVTGLENAPGILIQHRLQIAYKEMIELRKDGAPTGYIGLTGLKFLNYLWARVKLLDKTSKKYDNLKTAISYMDQFALAPGIKNEQLPTIRKLSPDPYYYNCYEKLFKELSVLMSVASRDIPLSSSACHMNDQCGTGNDSCDSDGECCMPTFQ
jgi:hypothetical protein